MSAEVWGRRLRRDGNAKDYWRSGNIAVAAISTRERFCRQTGR